MSDVRSNSAWLTPDTIPTDTRRKCLRIPDSEQWLSIVSGALVPLIYSANWEQFGASTSEEAAERAQQMLLEFFWDDAMLGSIFPYATNTPPYGCLPCDGSTFNRVDYPALYAALDAAFILDADTFKTPDLRGKFVFGSDLTRAVGATGGEENHTLTESEMPSHAHLYDKGIPNIDVEAPGVPDLAALGTPFIPTNSAYAGGGQAHNNMPPYLAMKWGIVAK